jgi:hypothetical protein
VADVKEGDLWYFPPGAPHSLGLGPDGCEFVICFDDGKADEFNTLLVSDWFAHTPPEVLGTSAFQRKRSQRFLFAITGSFRAPFQAIWRAIARQSKRMRPFRPTRLFFHLALPVPSRNRVAAASRSRIAQTSRCPPQSRLLS